MHHGFFLRRSCTLFDTVQGASFLFWYMFKACLCARIPPGCPFFCDPSYFTSAATCDLYHSWMLCTRNHDITSRVDIFGLKSWIIHQKKTFKSWWISMNFIDPGAHLIAVGEHCIFVVILWLTRPTLGALGGVHTRTPACLVRFLWVSRCLPW